jgi:Uncharacterized protein conserved in bacteria (DUF2252)
MKIRKATQRYEAWLKKQADLVNADLDFKHQRMAADPYFFFRATFYRWAQVWPEVCRELAAAPLVLAVGDSHVENFGTWRDAHGRLIWGVYDFDESYPLAYASDLVRLAVSAQLLAGKRLALGADAACAGILEGYRDGLKAEGVPFVLEEHHDWLRAAATGEARAPQAFWQELNSLRTLRSNIPKAARKALESLLPQKDMEYRVVHGRPDPGNLGRPAYVAIADWNGGMVACEARLLLPSACSWAQGGKSLRKVLYERVTGAAIRQADPLVRLKGQWLARRLAPDCSRLDLSAMPHATDPSPFPHAWGFETANIHLGSAFSLEEIRKHLPRLRPGWLLQASQQLAQFILKEWKEYCKSR